MPDTQPSPSPSIHILPLFLNTPTLCAVCVGVFAPLMLTGYCVKGFRCDYCANVADLALCQWVARTPEDNA